MTRSHDKMSGTVTPRNGTYTREHRDSDSDSTSTGRDWKGYAYDLEDEIKRLRAIVETLCGDAEAHRRD
jgi:hypothetical protein